ncbi:Flp family type IVb pilin [Sphingomonas sp. CJ20]
MRAIVCFARKLSLDRRAATAVEYGFILALIVLAIIGSLQVLSSVTTSMWNNVSDQVQGAGR